MKNWIVGFCLATGGALAASCSTPPVNHPPIGCSPKDQSGCTSDQRCEEVDGGQPKCFAPFVLKGTVTNISSGMPIQNARLVAMDASGNAFSDADVSNLDGSYNLVVPATRDATGKPTALTFTVRVDAQGYEPFPEAPRFAPVLDVMNAKGPPYVLQTTDTDVALLPVKNAKGNGMVAGSITSSDPGGTMVLVGARTGVADASGAYEVFNVLSGDAKVQAFKKGFNFDIATTTIMPDMQSKGLDFIANATPPVSVVGQLQVVNGGTQMATSVMLVLESTFDPLLNRGDRPPGLELTNVNGAFSIEGVPDGSFAVLAAFENDGLVRLPDTSISGSPIQHIVVAGSQVKLPQPLKVVGALGVVGLGANGLDMVTGAPTFGWQADPNADSYRLEVFDAYGTMTWSSLGTFSGGAGPSAAYAGPALQHGLVYQFRATSLKAGTPLTATEDLAGAFLYQ